MQAALDDFLAQVRSIERVIALREKLVEFGRVPPKQLLSPSASSLRGTVRQLRLPGMQPILDGSVLLLVAAFEQFVSDLMISFTEQLPQIIPVYRDLPNSIRSANERLTGEALVRGRSRFSPYERQHFVENLRYCQAGSTPYVLNGEAMAFNERNLKASILRELFGRIGIPDIWQPVGSTRTLKYWSGRGGAKVAASRAKTKLDELIDNRNQIAHRVGSTTIGPDLVHSYIRFERALAYSMLRALNDYAKTL